MTEQTPVPAAEAAVSGYSTMSNTPSVPVPPSTDPIGFVRSLEGDISGALQHPSPTTIHKAAADVVTVLGVALVVVGAVQSVVPPSRGTMSVVLTGIGSTIVMVRAAIERFAG